MVACANAVSVSGRLSVRAVVPAALASAMAFGRLPPVRTASVVVGAFDAVARASTAKPAYGAVLPAFLVAVAMSLVLVASAFSRRADACVAARAGVTSAMEGDAAAVLAAVSAGRVTAGVLVPSARFV